MYVSKTLQVREEAPIRRTGVDLDDLLVQIQTMRSRSAAASRSHNSRWEGTDELSATEQREQTLTTVEEISLAIEEILAANEDLQRQNQELINLNQAKETERQHYQQLFEEAPDAYLVTDQDGIIQEVNRAAATLLKIAPPSLVGQPLSLYISSITSQTFLNQLNQLPQFNQVSQWELCLQPQQGEPFDATLTIAVSRNFENNVSSLRWLIRDITEGKATEASLQKRNEQLEIRVSVGTTELEQAAARLRAEIAERQWFAAALSQREQEFRALVENAPLVIARFDEALRYLYINSEIEQVIGKLPQEVIGRTNRQLGIIEPNLSLWEDAIRWVFETGEQQLIEFSYLTPSGLKYYQARFIPELTANGFTESVLGICTDISDYKQTLEALLSREEQLRAIFEGAGIGIAQTSLEGRLIRTNLKLREMLGYSQQELKNRDLIEFTHPNDAIQDREFYELISGRRNSYHKEKRYIRKDGEIVWAYLTVSLVRGANDQPLFTIPMIEDITERKQAQELERQLIASLQESELRFRQFAENVRAVFWMVTPDHRNIIYISPAYDQIWGRNREDLSKNPSAWIEAIHPLDRDRVRAGVQLQAQQIQNQNYCELEYRIVRPDGSIRWIRDRGFGVHNEQGLLYRFVGVAEDITEHKQANLALQESEQRFRQLAENISEVFWMITGERTNFIYVSPAYENIWGRTCESLYENPRSWLEAVHPLDLDVVRAALKKQSEVGFDQDYRIVRPDGSIRWIHDRAFKIHDENGLLYRFVGIAEDITDRKQAEIEAFNALIKERELGDLKSRFVSMTSHEFRTPLSTIQSSAELLERYRQRFSEEKQQLHLSRIKTAVAQMTQMLNDILIIGEVDAGKLEFKPAPLDLVTFCHGLVEELQLSSTNQKAIAFTHQGDCTFKPQNPEECEVRQLDDCGSSLPLMDEKLLWRILSNLLSNALKYSPTGSLVEFDLSCLDNTVIFQIKDQGIGIPPEDQSRLFEPFHRANNVGTIQGTGLGLAIVKQCVELHQGEITVASFVGNTTFTVRLPLIDSMLLT